MMYGVFRHCERRFSRTLGTYAFHKQRCSPLPAQSCGSQQLHRVDVQKLCFSVLLHHKYLVKQYIDPYLFLWAKIPLSKWYLIMYTVYIDIHMKKKYWKFWVCFIMVSVPWPKFSPILPLALRCGNPYEAPWAKASMPAVTYGGICSFGWYCDIIPFLRH